MSDVTQILSQIEDGDGQAAEQLLPLVYDDSPRGMSTATTAAESCRPTPESLPSVFVALICRRR